MSELQRLQTTDWERRSLAETADATAHIYPDTARVIRELLSDYDVLRGETATLTAENERLRAQVGQLREAGERLRSAWFSANPSFMLDGICQQAHAFFAILAATAPTGEEVRE